MAKDTKTTSMTLSQQMIDDFNTLASFKNIAGQTLMKQILQDYIDDNFIRLVREDKERAELRESLKAGKIGY